MNIYIIVQTPLRDDTDFEVHRLGCKCSYYGPSTMLSDISSSIRSSSAQSAAEQFINQEDLDPDTNYVIKQCMFDSYEY